jgi:UDP:flavonoid glycosyltransferase YjiC (YdhE family)
MLKVLLAAWGSAGDVLPLVSIGRELKRRGHEVTVIAMPVFESAAAAAGLAFVAVGSAEIYRRLASPEVWSGRPLDPELARFMSRELPPVRVDRYLEVIESLHAPGRTVVVAHPRATGAQLARDRLGLPLAIVEYSPIGLASHEAPPHPPWPLPGPLKRSATVRRATQAALTLQHRLAGRLLGRHYPGELMARAIDERVQGLAARPGAVPRRDPSRRPRRLMIGAWPDWFVPLAPERNGNRALVGFVFEDPVAVRALQSPDGDDRDPSTRPIVFTMGSIAGGQHEFFAAAAEACRMLDRPGLLVTRYRDQIPALLPPRVAHLEHAPFTELFGKAAAVVHHGGMGTVALALAAGVPQVVRPLNWDHFDNADHMERLGVGLALNSRGIDPRRLARTLDAVLSSSALSDRCRYWRSRVDPVGGVNRAADLIEGLGIPAGSDAPQGS